MSKTVSMSEIAKAAGVAKSTVSMALRNHPRISKTERKRIQTIAQTMGYQTNPLVSRLMYELRNSRKEHYVATLALINCTTELHVRNRLYSVDTTCLGVEARASQLGYAIDTFWLYDPAFSINRLSNILHARNIQGLIFYPIVQENTISELDPEGLLWNHFPSVVIGVRPRQPSLTFAVNDHYATGFQLGNKLRQLGYKRIGFIIDRWLDEKLERRFATGFHASHTPGSSTVPTLYMKRQFGGPTPEENHRALQKWLDHYKPDACACLNRYVYDWIVEMGIRVPEDMGVAFIDLGPETEGMAGMNQRHNTEGMAAVDALISQILRRENSVPSFQQGITLESVWQMGRTVRDLRS